MVDFSITFNDQQVKKKLNNLGSAIKNFKKPLNDIGDELTDFYGNDVFKTQGKAIGEKWKKLSPATLKLRAERRGHYSKPAETTGKILIWTGALRKGFTKKVSKTKLVIANKVKYFKYHQQASGKPPQRKMLGINSKVITIVQKTLGEFIAKTLRK